MDQFIGIQLSQDWYDDYDDPYSAAEAWMLETRDERLATLFREIDEFFRGVPDSVARRDYFELNGAFPRNGEAFDKWLLAVRRRIELALAGVHTEPMHVPPGFYDEPA